MDLKKKKLCVALILCVGMCIQVSYASETIDSDRNREYDYTKEDTLLTGDSSIQPEDVELYQILNLDGRQYKLEEYTDDVIENVRTLEDSVQKVALLGKNWKPETTLSVKYNGQEVSLKLQGIDYKEETIRTEDIEVTQEYDQGNVQEYIDYDYKDDITDQTIYVKLKLQDQEVIQQEWRNTLKIPITIYDYDAGYYEFSGYDFYLNADGQLDINGKEHVILNYLGLDPQICRITEIQWSGDSYISNGIVCRKALATGDQLIDRIEATYAGQVQCPQTYTGTAYYKGEVSDGTYTHHMTFYYSEQHTVNVWMISAALIIVLLVIVLVLFIIKRKRKEGKKWEQ